MGDSANKTLGRLAYIVVGYYHDDMLDPFFMGDERTSLPEYHKTVAQALADAWRAHSMRHVRVFAKVID